MLLGSSRKRFLGAILKKSAALTLVSDIHSNHYRNRHLNGYGTCGDDSDIAADKVSDSTVQSLSAGKEKVISVDKLDWATAATTAAAVMGEKNPVPLVIQSHSIL